MMEIKRDHIEGSPMSVSTWAPSSGYVDMLNGAETPTSHDKAEGGKGLWTTEEHQNFIDGIGMYPSGPWKDIATNVGTRTARQTMTHAQKYRQKIARRLRNARMNAQQPLPFNLDAASPKYNVLLANDEQFNDSILSTTLAIAAEKELDAMEEMLGGTSAATKLSSDFYVPLSPRSQALYTSGASAYASHPSHHEDTDIAFDECIDFLIAKLHQDPLP